MESSVWAGQASNMLHTIALKPHIWAVLARRTLGCGDEHKRCCTQSPRWGQNPAVRRRGRARGCGARGALLRRTTLAAPRLLALARGARRVRRGGVARLPAARPVRRGRHGLPPGTRCAGAPPGAAGVACPPRRVPGPLQDRRRRRGMLPRGGPRRGSLRRPYVTDTSGGSGTDTSGVSVPLSVTMRPAGGEVPRGASLPREWPSRPGRPRGRRRARCARRGSCPRWPPSRRPSRRRP